MSHDIILNLLFCAKDHSLSDREDLIDSFEFLEENVWELEEFKKYYPDKDLLAQKALILHNKVNEFIDKEVSGMMTYCPPEPWNIIRSLALNILNELEIKYMDPWEYLDDYYEGR